MQHLDVLDVEGILHRRAQKERERWDQELREKRLKLWPRKAPLAAVTAAIAAKTNEAPIKPKPPASCWGTAVHLGMCSILLAISMFRVVGTSLAAL